MKIKRPVSNRFGDNDTAHRQNWRAYQMSLKRTSLHRRIRRKTFRYIVLLMLFAVGIYAVLGGVIGVACHNRPQDTTDANGNRLAITPFDKHRIQSLLGDHRFTNLKEKKFGLIHEGKHLQVETSLEMPLQNFLFSRLNTTTSRHIAIIAMEPRTGRVLAMVSFDKEDATNNLCLNSHFPAASIFKVVTAAAAIEKHHFKPNTVMTYNGKKYTLYKSQLKEKKNKWTRKITLKDSFAQSVNPVFGKLGALHLKRSDLMAYADAFGFNRQIDFEIPLPPSSIIITDDPYQRAEIASGFNRITRISPLHGALMASAIVNSGRLIEPTIVDRIKNEKGDTIYRGKAVTVQQAIKPAGAETITGLMTETIKSGTSRKIFRGYKRDKILSRLNIGGKTGSIDNDNHDVRYDWFVGFAEEKNGSEKIVFSIVVGHEKYIGIRAAAYAKMAMKHYFKNHFAGITKKNKDNAEG